MYYWTHTENPANSQYLDLAPGRLTPMWPPAQSEIEDGKPGRKYTEAGMYRIFFSNILQTLSSLFLFTFCDVL